MRKLYWRIYTGFVLIVLLFALMVVGLWFLGHEDSDREQTFQAISLTLGEMLPDESRPIAELSSVLTRLGERFDSSLRVYAAAGNFIAASDDAEHEDLDEIESGWNHDDDGGSYSLALPDGRWIVAHKERRRDRPWFLVVLALALAIAIGAHPLARRITRRLEHLQSQMEALGQGDLSARVTVEGHDEVAELAGHFNRAAQRIEALVEAQRSTLASASHELRTPLTRIRMAIELFDESTKGNQREKLIQTIVADIAELDDLIDELLLASRLRAQPEPEYNEPVDVLALMAEEGARVDAQVSGEPTQVNASARLLKRLVRNLFENARRYGCDANGQAIISARLELQSENTLCIEVQDSGPGIPEDLREQIFEPFFRPPGLREGKDPGVGLGLSLVRDIAHHYGGDVRYEQPSEGGSRFVVELQLKPSTK